MLMNADISETEMMMMTTMMTVVVVAVVAVHCSDNCYGEDIVVVVAAAEIEFAVVAVAAVAGTEKVESI